MGAKSLSYAVNMAAQRWARAHHADDAIFAAAGGLVREATTSAVVIARGQQLLSPPVSLGILPSITVGRLFACAAAAGWETGFDRLTVDDLRRADGVWLLSSVRYRTTRSALRTGRIAEVHRTLGPRG
jgi:4-amino-4-deoxychorismate lyase